VKRLFPGGVTKIVLSTDMVASQIVANRHRYQFAITPGPYVLGARYAKGGTAEPWVPTVIHASKVTRQNIPNQCR
jgi:hypothetical protein